MVPTSASPNRRDPVEILIVDDNSMDLMLAKEAHRASGSASKLVKVSSGEAVIALLQQRAAESMQASSCLVLLDLNMPRLDGENTLVRIRKDPKIATTPVIMLTTSASEADIERCYGAGANGYIVKPVGFDMLIGLFRQLETFWSEYVRQPKLPPSKKPRWL